MKLRALFFTLFVLFTGLNAFSQQFTLNFDMPAIINNGNYIDVQYNNIYNGGEPGAPALPVYNYNILLPQNTELSSLQITDIQYYNTTKSGVIIPTQTPMPVSSESKENIFTQPDKTIYSSEIYPASAVKNHSTHFLSGHGIATFNICPVEYHPNSGTIRFISSITIKYSSSNTKKDICQASRKRSVTSRVKAIVANPEKISTYNYIDKKDEHADMLIITKAEYIPLMEEFVSYKQSVGFFVNSVSTEDVFANYSGLDEQEQIRNCIKDQYENTGIEYVLFVGDADPANEDQKVIPHRGMKAVDDYDIPADLYYSNLDGNWDENGNGVWGEVGEGDLFAEVAIGRFCVDSPGEIAHMIHKNIMYQNDPVIDDANKFLLVGENLNNSPLTWGGTYMDELYYGTSNHGFETAAISNEVETTRVYDRDGSWNPKTIRDNFNINGLNFLNHLGHSNVSYNMKMENQDLTTTHFRNNGVDRGYCIGYSQGCYNGSFDNRGTNYNHSTGDCFAEKITTMETAYVACIANSRYGWYQPANTNSSSQFYNRNFFHALFGMGITQIGWANSYSKEAETSWLDGEYFRWTAYELNLFGDPSLDIYTAKPEAMLVSLPGTIIEGTTEITFKSNAANARIAILHNDVLIARTFTDENGESVITLPSPAVNGESYEISVIAHNKLRYVQQIDVTANTPVVICTNATVDDSEYNGNGIAEYGETVLIDLTFANKGDKACGNTTFSISIDNSMISVTGNTIETGSIAPGEEVTLSGALSLEIDPDIAPKDVVVNVISEEMKSWSSAFILNIGSAIPEITAFSTSEQSTEPNGRVDAGEEALLSYTIKNSGNAAIENIEIKIEPKDIFVTCAAPNYSTDILEAGESLEINFVISTDINTPDGFTSFIDFQMTAARGKNYAAEHYTFIGLPRILVCDLDRNENSGPAILEDLKLAGASAEYFNNIPDNINDYDAIFLTLGVFPYVHKVTPEEGELFANYLSSGKSMYVESGSFWYFNDHTALHDMMNISSAIGNGWLYGNEQLTGVYGTFGEGMEFGYTGDNDHIDHLDVTDPTQLIFTSEPNTFGAMATHVGENYNMVATSFEWSGLVPANSETTRVGFMEEIIDFMELNTARPPKVSLGQDATICKNHQIVLDAGDGFSEYLWSNGETTQTIIVDTLTFKEDINIISVEVIDVEGYKAFDEVEITFDPCYGIDDPFNLDVTVYPNPAKDFITIEYPAHSFTAILMDMTGKTVQSSLNNKNETTLNTHGLQSGVYILRLEADFEVIQKKIIIK